MCLCVKGSSSVQVCSMFFYLKYLLTADLDAAVAGLGLLLRKFLPQDLQLLHQVSLVFGHRQALCLFRQLGWGQHLLRAPRTTLVLQLSRMTRGIMWWKGRRKTNSKGGMEGDQQGMNGQMRDKKDEQKGKEKSHLSVWFTTHLNSSIKTDCPELFTVTSGYWSFSCPVEATDLYKDRRGTCLVGNSPASPSQISSNRRTREFCKKFLL